MGLTVKLIRIPILVMPMICCVTLDSLLTLSLHFFIYEDGDYI